jgi:hypothetical protein
MALSHYRWALQLAAVVSLAVGFKLNVLQRTGPISRIVYWSAVFLTVATLVRWGWGNSKSAKPLLRGPEPMHAGFPKSSLDSIRGYRV